MPSATPALTYGCVSIVWRSQLSNGLEPFLQLGWLGLRPGFVHLRLGRHHA